MDNANTMKNDEAIRREFAEMVQSTERAAAQLARPWKISTGILAAAVVTLTLLNMR